MLNEAALASFVATLFSMMNPIGNVGIFSGMTAGRPDAESKQIAWTCAAAAAITLIVVCWVGTLVLAFFGISIDALRAAGGLIILLIGLQMLSNKSDHRHTPDELGDAEARTSIAIVPLAIPIVAGPGTMAAVLVAAQQHPGVLSKVEISVVILGVSALTGLLFSFATPAAKWLGSSGIGVVTRIMGMILTAMAIGMLAEGLKVLLPGLAG